MSYNDASLEEEEGFWISLLKGSKREKLKFMTPGIEFWLNFGSEAYDLDFVRHLYLPKNWLEKNKKKNPLFFGNFWNFRTSIWAPQSQNFFKFDKATKFAVKKSTYNENFKSFARKLWLWRTICHLFWDTLNLLWKLLRHAFLAKIYLVNITD